MLVKLTPTDFDALMASARAGLQAQATLLDAINKSAIEQVKAEKADLAQDDENTGTETGWFDATEPA